MAVGAAIACAAAVAAGAYYINYRLEIISDIKLLIFFLYRTDWLQWWWARNDCVSLYDRLLSQAQARPDAVFLRPDRGNDVTYAMTRDRVDQWARFLHEELGLTRGDHLAMVFGNSDNFVYVFLACSALGVVPAFINYNLTGPPLGHCITVSRAGVVLYETRYAASLASVAQELQEKNVTCVAFTGQQQVWPAEHVHPGVRVVTWEDVAQYGPRSPLASARSGTSWKDPLCLIYTSGTTGMPKAALVSNSKYLYGGCLGRHLMQLGRARDVVYVTIPLYHSTGTIFGLTSVLLSGTTIAIGTSFSARAFWKECVRLHATHFVYIGELCRYLLNAPSADSPEARGHKVWCAYGNGLRPDVWPRFQEKFGIRRIVEFYASTEGTSALFNASEDARAVGAVGRLGLFGLMVLRSYSQVVRLDPETGELVRNSRGHCVRTAPGEPGELLQVVAHKMIDFSGYYDGGKATGRSKVVHNAFRPGDAWYRTGDLMQIDKHGYYRFCDRLGDTFRWKGENVSTAEVAYALDTFRGGGVITESNVYGVRLPGHEGRIGCAALARELEHKLDMHALALHVEERLPKYARPMFLRFTTLQHTATNKQQKQYLREEGVDPARVSRDPVYWLAASELDGPMYVPFSAADYEAIAQGRIKL